jgi:hypothetical protein
MVPIWGVICSELSLAIGCRRVFTMGARPIACLNALSLRSVA